MNHHGLFIKIMDRSIPVNLLSLLTLWFSLGLNCIKWGSVVSRFVDLSCRVRQGGVLSPHFIAIYINSVVKKVSDSKNGCYIKGICMSILLYADDILLVAPSVTALQSSATAASV